MTDAELNSLYARRQAALEINRGMAGRSIPLCEMSEIRRDRSLANSREFRETDRLIVAELSRRKAPAILGGITLHLTGDGLNFVTLSSATGELVFGCHGSKSIGAGILYHHPERERSPESSPAPKAAMTAPVLRARTS